MNGSNIQTYSNKIKIRIRILQALFILMLIYMVVIGELGLGDSRIMTSTAQKVSKLIFFGSLIFIFIQIFYYRKLLKSRTQLLQQQILEMDERAQFLHDKSGGMVVDILLVFLLVTTCTAALSNMTAFYLSYLFLIIVVFLKITCYFYYRKKYG